MKSLYCILTISYLFIINISKAQVAGCTDPLATNFNSYATNNDGSCVYQPANISPATSFNLTEILKETSGLIYWNNQIWTHNDNNDTNIYSLDTANGNILQTYPLIGAINTDWEEISQDSNYIYIGDFGNNGNGNRTDLKILRIEKKSILNNNSTIIDTINFSYSDQSDFSPSGANNTDFDCEAFIVSSDSIYLFTKQWVSKKTGLYSISKNPGTYIANFKSALNVQGLITGAVNLESQKITVLCGYSDLVQPFFYLLYDYKDYDFFSGNKRKISISLSFHQVEGIATNNGLKYYISNEYLNKPPFVNTAQKLHTFNLSSLLSGYLNNITSLFENALPCNFSIFPVPASDTVNIKADNCLPSNYTLTNQLGNIVLKGKFDEESFAINISNLPAGVYVLNIHGENVQRFKVVKY